MITFIYPKEDWTAAELAMKVRGLAGTKNMKVYSTPKHGRRDDEQVYNRLRKTEYAIFIAYDQIHLDRDTEEELGFLKERRIPIYFVIPEDMNSLIRELGFSNNIYSYQLGNIDHLREILNKILKELVIKKVDSEDFWGLIILIGLILLALFFIAGITEEVSKE